MMHLTKQAHSLNEHLQQLSTGCSQESQFVERDCNMIQKEWPSSLVNTVYWSTMYLLLVLAVFGED